MYRSFFEHRRALVVVAGVRLAGRERTSDLAGQDWVGAVSVKGSHVAVRLSPGNHGK